MLVTINIEGVADQVMATVRDLWPATTSAADVRRDEYCQYTDEPDRMDTLIRELHARRIVGWSVLPSRSASVSAADEAAFPAPGTVEHLVEVFPVLDGRGTWIVQIDGSVMVRLGGDLWEAATWAERHLLHPDGSKVGEWRLTSECGMRMSIWGPAS